jgi:hypothetical protein
MVASLNDCKHVIYNDPLRSRGQRDSSRSVNDDCHFIFDIIILRDTAIKVTTMLKGDSATLDTPSRSTQKLLGTHRPGWSASERNSLPRTLPTKTCWPPSPT